MKNQVIQGDCLTKLKTLDENSVDSIVTDPPYELGFMGKSWDNTGIANNKEMWAECLRVLKPGGHLLSFGGTRTYHRMAVAIEDAGFEVRDMIEWVYGSGFPKSLNIGKAVDKLQGNEREVVGEKPTLHHGTKDNVQKYGFATEGNIELTKGTSEWEGWGTALKPAHEPICMARKPLAEKTVAENVLKYGTGGINIDESRVGTEEKLQPSSSTKMKFGGNAMLESKTMNDPDWIQNSNGRFPANLIHDNSEEIRECFPEVKGKKPFKKLSSFNFDVGGEHKKQKYESQAGLGETGNASRFFKSIPIEEQDEIQEECTDMEEKLEKLGLEQQDLQKNSDEYWNNQAISNKSMRSLLYQAKASKSERNKGCGGLPLGEPPASARSKPAEGRENALGKPRANNHPTVKPIALMEYLIKMVTPKGGIVLDPFAGSGSTLVAAKQNGYKYIGIELTPEYIDIINARLK